jgi:hypothetical protein
MTQRWLLYGRQRQRQAPSSSAQPPHPLPPRAQFRTRRQPGPGFAHPARRFCTPLNPHLPLQTRPRAAQAAKAQSTRAVRGSVVVRAAVRSNWLPGNDFPAHVRVPGGLPRRAGIPPRQTDAFHGPWAVPAPPFCLSPVHPALAFSPSSPPPLDTPLPPCCAPPCHPVQLENAKLPGNFGFDPLGLGADAERLAYFAESERVHCRWAMLGVAGIMLQVRLGGLFGRVWRRCASYRGLAERNSGEGGGMLARRRRRLPGRRVYYGAVSVSAALALPVEGSAICCPMLQGPLAHTAPSRFLPPCRSCCTPRPSGTPPPPP